MNAGKADDGSDGRTASRGAKTIAVVLLVVAGGAAVAGAFEGGVAAIAEGVVLVYIAVVLAYGVFTDRLDDPVTQTGFGVGLTAYGGVLYLDGGALLWLGVALVGAALSAYNGREILQPRR